MEERSGSTLGDYVLRWKVAESQSSSVWNAQHRISGEVVALKLINAAKLTRHLRSCLDCELTFLSSVYHPNIVRLINVLKFEDCTVLVMEFCDGGNLASYIRRRGAVEESLVKNFLQQLGAGLNVLKQHHVIHRDLKPENILLSCTKCDPILKISDFGLSRILHPDEYAATVCGSPRYMAPEILQFQQYDDKVDMWSLGAILFELLNGYPPFSGKNNVQLVQNIKASTSLPFSHLILPYLDPECVDLCSRLLSTDPNQRLSFEEFYQHKFLRN